MNKALLRYEMDRANVSVNEMCGVLGISRKAFWSKCNGRTEFKQSEIAKIINFLDLKEPSKIFFNDEVS